ncbi:coordinator of PRMT5 and differentiation stimulator isoform X3 [Emydura macquarii macquarii]|uniref:coordinator of PRMT5 and differentiation stimulator isoform X3 n=1 Tax=Emydura macquarii macquarii TaxID=1129001 RepID=UPI00352BCC78
MEHHAGAGGSLHRVTCRMETIINTQNVTDAAGNSEEEELVKGEKTVNWRPRKGHLARSISDAESHQSRFSDCSCYESDTTHLDSDSLEPSIKIIGDFDDFQSDLENWELEDEAGLASFPELKIDSQYEEEDWDKELEDAECNPYGSSIRTSSRRRRKLSFPSPISHSCWVRACYDLVEGFGRGNPGSNQWDAFGFTSREGAQK